MAEKRRQKIAQALERLAALYEWGALVAATDPAGLIEDVCDEIERLRARVAELEAERAPKTRDESEARDNG